MRIPMLDTVFVSTDIIVVKLRHFDPLLSQYPA